MYIFITLFLFFSSSVANDEDYVSRNSVLFENTISDKKNLTLDLTVEESYFLKKKKNLYIANELDWLPFDFYENNTPKGFIVDYIKLVAKKLDLNAIFISKKWLDLINDLKKEKIDILPVLSYNKKRENYLLFSNEFYSQELVLTVKSSNNDIKDIKSLRNKKVGMIKNWNLTKILKKNYPYINIIEFDSLKDIFEAIKNGFIDATLQNSVLSNYYINQNYYGLLKSTSKLSLKDFDSKLYMGIRKNLPILHKLINKAITSISKKELDILEQKWIKTTKNATFSFEEKEFIKNVKIRAITGNQWPPFTFVQNEKLYGISVDLWNYILNKTKLKSTMEVKYDFTKLLDSFKNKKSDIVLATSISEDKNKYAIFTNTYLTAPIGIATLQDKNYIKSAKELLGKRIAVGKNYSAHKLLEKEYPNMKLVFVKNAKEGLEYVSKNRAYAYVDIMPVLTYGIQKNSFTNIKISGQTGLEFKLVSMIRSDYPLLKSIINKTLKNMTFEEKQALFDRWLKTEFEKQFDYSLLWKIILVFSIILFYVLYKNRQLKNYQKKLQRSQNQAQDSLENFKTLMNLNIAGILILREKKIIYLNDEIIRMLEFNTKKDLINKNISDIFSLEDIQKINSIDKNSNASYNSKAKKVNNKEIPVLIRSNYIIFENQESCILSVVDLSDIKNKEKIMMQQTKLAGLGEMIGNIAHQWRQPLSYISTAASGMKIQKEYNKLSDKEFHKLTDAIVDTTMFLSQTIDAFRDYIKGEKIKKEFELRNSIQRILSMMKGTFVNDFIKIHDNIENIKIIGYENELNQVFLNILTNSKDALNKIKQEDRNIFLNSFVDNKNIKIEIIDTGGGIKQNIINKIFEPYYTTKHKSQGTGLGLYMTHNIIKESMKGDIIIENIAYLNFKNCTKVSIFLPLC